MSESTGDMASAVEAAFSAASTPDVASTTTVETPAPSASETATPDVSQAAASATTTTTQPGPIPYERFKEVNDKAQAASKQLETLGWAKDLDPGQARAAIDLLTRAKANPLAFAEELESLRDHPVFGPQLRSWAARTLGTRQAAAQPHVEDEPQPDIPLEDGRFVYSAAQQQKREQWFLKNHVGALLDERMAPLAKANADHSAFVAEKTYADLQAKAMTDGKSEIDSIRSQYPQFDEHKAAVAEAMEANPTWNLNQAWAHVFVSKVGPQLASQHAASVTKKVQAGSANPARPSGATPQVPGSIREHLELLMTN